ncbi:MAG: hypothetical protein SPF89_02165 [Sphaerochaetaceae bacterium]|nr:hypothetical protein [Spirochaetales bacterium]MDY5498891.1 hypothetical protein [Sphaerochaetaceae bacterium]
MIGISILFFLSNPIGKEKAFSDRLVFPLPKIDLGSGEMEDGILDKTMPTAMMYSLGNAKEKAEGLDDSTNLGEYALFLKPHCSEVWETHLYRPAGWLHPEGMDGTGKRDDRMLLGRSEAGHFQD